MNPNQVRELQQWFARVDSDRSGSISAQELKNLTFGGIPLGYENALKLVKVFDRDRSGGIDFQEYATLHKFITSMQDVFARTDTDRNGTLDAREIHGALAQSGFQLSFQAVSALFQRHAKGQFGIHFPAFLSLAADIALMKSQFEWRDTAKQGRITVTLDDLLCLIADV